MLQDFIIQRNEYLNQNVKAFYHTNYVGHGNPGNPDYINKLKNTYGDFSNATLNMAVQELADVLSEDFPQIFQKLQFNSLTVSVVPRAKAHSIYAPNQLLFKSAVSSVAKKLNGFYDGTDYIVRHANTKTTHLRKPIPNYNNDGPEPYPGITAETCNISNNVKGKNVLLIDDLYTKTVNIDEDAIQVLLDNGAKSVTFYAVGNTVYNR